MHTFPKSAKLCGQLRIARLYREGKRFTQWPLRVTFLPAEEATEVLIWAPKALFKHAVDRNRLRRLIREAYRLQSNVLSGDERHWQVAFNYMDKQEQPYPVIEKAVRKALEKITKQ